MEAIVERACGLDVHQAIIVACVLLGPPDKRPLKETVTFGTTTAELERLRDWLADKGVTAVGMEATGVYWMPVYRVLEDRFVLVVGNAAHIKAVPGRKTDVKDAEWLADLVRHGLIRRSFVPPKWQRDLRDLVRYRRKLIEQQASERNRLIKMLEIGNIKLSTVASDVFGVSGRAMIRALIDGEATPEQMAQLARGALRKKTNALAMALRGHIDEHHRFLLRIQLERTEQIEQDVAKVDTRIDEVVTPYADVLNRLRQIPGVDREGSLVFLAEAGPDMSIFPTANHLAAWAGVCPSNRESAGKRSPQGKRTGNVHLTTALVQAAASASRKKGSYLKEKFWRLQARRGYKRALVAIAHRIVVAAYHMLSNMTDYRDLGAAYLDSLDPNKTRHRLIKKLESMGYQVTLKPTEAPAVA